MRALAAHVLSRLASTRSSWPGRLVLRIRVLAGAGLSLGSRH